MQEENITTNTYWADNERFADIMNVGMFQSKKVLSADKLKEVDSYLKTMVGKPKKKTGVQKYRDVVKKAAFDANFVIVGIENQTDIHYAMPVRVMGYDFLNYDKQLKEIKRLHRKNKDLTDAEFVSGFSKEDKLSPICTLVLYYGEEPWDGPTRLSELLSFEGLPDEVREVIADYPIHVIDMRRFEDSEKLETDARLLFGVMQRDGNVDELEVYRAENEEAFQNISDDTYEVIATLTKSEEFLDLKEESRNEKGGVNVCEAFRQLKERGAREYLKHLVKGKMENGDDTQKIASDLLEDVDVIEGIIAELQGEEIQATS